MHGTGYDDAAISTYARALYRRSGLVEWMYVVCGVGGFALGGVVLATGALLPPASIACTGLATGALGGVLGWALGQDRALAMRCCAQVALAQVQIELNTRLAVFHLTVRPTSLPEAAGSGPHRAAGARPEI